MKTEIKKNEHDVGIGLLRIVAMLMIVLLHLVYHTYANILEKAPAASIMAGHALRAVTLVCVECHAMIGGYVMVYSKPGYACLPGVRLQTMFYTEGICGRQDECM